MKDHRTGCLSKLKKRVSAWDGLYSGQKAATGFRGIKMIAACTNTGILFSQGYSGLFI